MKNKIVIVICAIMGVLMIVGLGWFIGTAITNRRVQKENAEEREQKEEKEKKEEKESKKEETKDSNKITITFDSNGGTAVEMMEYECGSKIQLPETQREGYQFVSWINQDNTIIKDDSILDCHDTTLIASWKKEKSYHCPEGYTLNGKDCERITEFKDKAECPKGTYERKDQSKSKGMCYDLDQSKVVKEIDICDSKEIEVGGEKVVVEGQLIGQNCYYGEIKLTDDNKCNGYIANNGKCYLEEQKGFNKGCSDPEHYGLVISTSYQFGIDLNVEFGCYPYMSKNLCENKDDVVKDGKCFSSIPATIE